MDTPCTFLTLFAQKDYLMHVCRKEIAELNLKNKTYAPGNAQKNYEFFLGHMGNLFHLFLCVMRFSDFAELVLRNIMMTRI